MMYLTGIKPTGDLHFGNYLSAIEPLTRLNYNDKVFLFIADGHSLTTQPNPKELSKNILSISASLISFFKYNENVFIYRQSDIPEIFELFWILSCFTAKGYLNRCHAYYTKVQENLDKNKDPDKGIFNGLYNYPVLMAADILCLNPDFVPVGKDQKQHMEIVKDVVRKINHVYKKNILKQPNEIILATGEVPGIDNRKMSKSYKNTVPVLCSSKKLKKSIFSFITNCKEEGEQKYRFESPIFRFFEMVVKDEDIQNELDDILFYGRSWKTIKHFIYDHINNMFQDNRNEYERLLNNVDEIETVLALNANIIRRQVQDNVNKIKKEMGF